MSWWAKLFGRKPDAERNSGPSASWIAADKNRFGIPVLDLVSITGKLLSTSKNPDEAAMAISWSSKLVADLALDFTPAESLACNLCYPADADLPDGWLFIPSAMEQKWAIAFRNQAIYLIRSWTGEVKAVGRTRRDASNLVIDRIEHANDVLRMFGDPIETFDWMIRAHALHEILPMPVDAGGAKMLESIPLSVFSVFGNVAAYAAQGWSPPQPERPLRSIGDLTSAVRTEQPARVAELVTAGASLDSKGPVLGFTALQVAAIKGNVKLARLLLELGANPNVLADRDASILITAVVHRAPRELLDLLVEHGAVAVPNADGFGLIHAIAETDHAEYLPWALGLGLELDARTKRGHTPLHIAAALGHVVTLEALIAAGADRTVCDPQGKSARDIARAEGKLDSLRILER